MAESAIPAPGGNSAPEARPEHHWGDRAAVPSELLSLGDFPSAARASLSYLAARFDVARWVVTVDVADLPFVLSTSSPALAVGMPLTPDHVETTCYSIALRSGRGEVLAQLRALDIIDRSDDLRADHALLELISGLLGLLLDNESRGKLAEARAQQAEAESLVDELTGLANRRAWQRALGIEEDRTLRYGHASSVLIVDLDELKIVNDTLGHAAGDDLLKRTAGALRKASRDHDTVARLGGDEFGVLAVHCTGGQADVLSRRLSEELAAAGVRASVGVASRHPAGGLSRAWVRADAQMYALKRRHAEGA